MDEVAVEVKWTRSEFIRAVQRGYRPQWLDVVIVLVTTLAGLSEHGLNLLYPIVGIVGVALMHYVFAPRIFWNRVVDAELVRKSAVRQSGIEIVSPSQELKVPWKRVKRTWETNYYYFIEIERTGFASPLSKEAFKSPSDEALFRKLLSHNSNASLKVNSTLDALAG